RRRAERRRTGAGRAPRQGQRERRVGGGEQDGDQVEAGRTPAGQETVQGEGDHDERPVIRRPVRRGVPEVARERGERARGFAQEGIVDDQVTVVEDEIEAGGRQVRGPRQEAHEGEREPAGPFHEALDYHAYPWRTGDRSIRRPR